MKDLDPQEGRYILVRFLLFNLLIISNFSLAKIASFDLCADQWLMTFAKPEQVAFLTPLSKDSSISYYHEKAKGYAVDIPSIENLISRDIKTVIATDHMGGSIKKILEKNGIKVVIIPTITTLNQLILWAEKIKDLTHGDNEIIMKLQSVKDIKTPKKTALYIGTAGSSPGQQTLVNNALSLAGFKNINRYKGWQYNDIETIIVQNPDYIFTAGTLSKKFISGGYHKYEKVTQAVVIPISQSYTVCACPKAFIDLVKVFADAKK